VPPMAVPGYWRQHVHKDSAHDTGSPLGWSGTTNRTPVTDRPGALGWRRGPQYRRSRVVPVEGRNLSSRRTQHVVSDLEIGQPINSDKCSETVGADAKMTRGAEFRSTLPNNVGCRETASSDVATAGSVGGRQNSRKVSMRISANVTGHFGHRDRRR